MSPPSVSKRPSIAAGPVLESAVMRAQILPLILILVGPGVAGPGSALAQPAPGRAREAPAAKAAPAGPRVEASFLRGLKARIIGPAIMGGRVSDIALDPKDPFTFYVALGTGGIMKTADNGVTFDAVFTKEAVAAVGAVAVSPADPKVVWVGTGEANDRNSSSWGNGVYRSTDGGATWKHAGLEKSRTIARVVVHRKDPKTVVAIVQSDEGGTTDFREVESKRGGVFRSDDGGDTWARLSPLDPRPFYFSQIR